MKYKIIISLIATIIFGVITGFTFANIFRESGWSLGFITIITFMFFLSIKLMIAFDYRVKQEEKD